MTSDQVHCACMKVYDPSTDWVTFPPHDDNDKFTTHRVTFPPYYDNLSQRMVIIVSKLSSALFYSFSTLNCQIALDFLANYGKSNFFCFRINDKSYFTPYPLQWGSSYFLIVWFCFFLFCQMTHSVRIFQSLDKSVTLKYFQRSFMDLSSKSMLGNVLYWCLNSEELMLRQITLTCVSITVKGKLIFILTMVSIFCPLYKNSSWQREPW